MKFSFHNVGFVENNIVNRSDMPAGGVQSHVNILPEYVKGLEYIEENSHLLITGWLNYSNTDTLTVTPKKFGLIHTQKGVFATRSPDRPVPVSITACKLIDKKENILYLNKLDLINGTPIIDIKPYAQGSDCIFNTNSINERKNLINATDEQFYEYLKRGILNYCYLTDTSLDLGIYSLILLTRKTGIFPDRYNIDYVITDYTANALDCLYYYFKFTPGENKIRLYDSQKTINTHLLVKFINKDQYIITAKNSEIASTLNDMIIEKT